MLGTRGSDLARAQTAMAEAALRAAHPNVELAVQMITTRGDERVGPAPEPVDVHAGRKGLFTREIERALLDGRIDVAVHSAKDLPSDAMDRLEICAALPRAAMDDVLIAKLPHTAATLPNGSTVATGSVRRQHQLRCWRQDLKIDDLRGNVPTRLRKLVASDWHAIILARAGLERLGFECSASEIRFEEHAFTITILPQQSFLPAGGQGVVALQVRANDAETNRIVKAVNHADTLLCLRAEREFLRLLQGDCGTPVGVLATIQGGTMQMRAQIFENNAASARTGTLHKALADAEPEAIGAELLELINER